MKTVNCLRSLERYGVVCLTGEADNLSYRILCDLTRKGADILAECYGLNPDGFLPSWNPGSDADPHVGSIEEPSESQKLPHAVFEKHGLLPNSGLIVCLGRLQRFSGHVRKFSHLRGFPKLFFEDLPSPSL